MGLLRNAPLVVALALGGCTYVTPDTFAIKVACLDEDDDGHVAKDDCPDLAAGEPADCDDSRADRFPGNTEVPYDGIDQDCSSADLVDIDGDLHPGVLESAWTAQHPGISWPTNLNCGGDGCGAEDLDCNDNAATTFPGSGAEIPYDGVDANCDGKDDWDFDGDGHVPPDSVHDGVAYTGTLPQDDCDDTRVDVYPGTVNPALTPARQADVFYDGIDNDCDGANDYDKDGDDYIRDTDGTAYLAFLARYEYADDRPCKLTDGTCNDCDDDPSNDGAQPKTATQINPGATETYYDGVDQDCDGQDDYDQDLDGFSCDGTADAACTGHAGDDCDDGLSDINPAQLELLGDAVDQDCSGDDDAPRFNFGGLAWTDPSTPDIARTDEHFVIAASASSFAGGGVTVAGPAASAVTVSVDAIDGSGDFDKVVSLEPLSPNDLQPVGRAIALYGEPNVFTFALSVFDLGTDERTRLRVRQFQWLSASNIYFERLATSQTDALIDSDPPDPAPAGYDPDPYLDFDVQKASDGGMWGVGCSLETIHFTIAKPNGSTMLPARGAYASTLAGSAITGGGSTCWLALSSATAGTVHAYEGATYRQFALDGTAASEDVTEVAAPTHSTSAFAPNDVRHRGQYVVFARNDIDTGTGGNQPGITVHDTGTGNNVSLSTSALGTPISADLGVAGGTFYLAAVIDPASGDPFVALWVGTGPSTMGSPHEIPFEDDAGSLPTGVAVYGEDDATLLLAVSGVSTGSVDAVGWAFLGIAP